MKFLLAAALLATLVAERLPVMQDPQPRVLLQLEDDWAQALIHRDAAVFRRLLADGFIYTEDDRTVGRDDVLHDVVAGLDTVTTAHNEAMRVHRFGATAVVTGWLVSAAMGRVAHLVAGTGSRIPGSVGTGVGRSLPRATTWSPRVSLDAYTFPARRQEH